MITQKVVGKTMLSKRKNDIFMMNKDIKNLIGVLILIIIIIVTIITVIIFLEWYYYYYSCIFSQTSPVRISVVLLFM